MCPDKPILSAYFDNEVEGDHKAQIDEHVKSCDQCRMQLEKWKKLRSFLILEDDVEIENRLANNVSLEERKRRVWEGVKIRRKSANGFWRKQISIPMPFMAAAAMFLILIAGAFFFYSGGNNTVPNGTTIPALASDNSSTIQISKEDLADLIQLIQNNETQEVSLDLPDKAEFADWGEPVIYSENELSGSIQW